MSTFNYYICDRKTNIMTNITEKTNVTDMRSHIKQARLIINEFLPKYYTDQVLQKTTPQSGITPGIIRNVKKGMSDRIDVLNAMVEVALENKELLEKFKKNVTK